MLIHSPMWAEIFQALHWNWLVKINLWFLDCLKRMWSFLWDKQWRIVRKGFSAMCPYLLTLLDGRAAMISSHRGRLLDCIALPTNVSRCNRVHSRQTHAVTFWLCSSIVVAIFVTFWNYLLFWKMRHWLNMLSLRLDHRLWLKNWSFCTDEVSGWCFYFLTQAPWSQGSSCYDQSGSVWYAALKLPTSPVYLSLPGCLQMLLFEYRATQYPALVFHVCCDCCVSH